MYNNRIIFIFVHAFDSWIFGTLLGGEIISDSDLLKLFSRQNYTYEECVTANIWCSVLFCCCQWLMYPNGQQIYIYIYIYIYINNSWYESVHVFYCIGVYIGQLGGVSFRKLCGDIRHLASVSSPCLSKANCVSIARFFQSARIQLCRKHD